MRLNILTIVLDGMPWLPCIFVQLNRLNMDWRWLIAEGVSEPKADTAWINRQAPRLSRDGTHTFLKSMELHPRVRVVYGTSWGGKTAMFNNLLQHVAGGIILQQDSDEIWTKEQYEKLIKMFEDDTELSGALFKMRYFLGPNIVSTSVDGYGNRAGEWMRAWRHREGGAFQSHEPPVYNNNEGKTMSREETADIIGLVDHYAWATHKQVAAKELLYGKQYAAALMRWNILQGEKMPINNLEEMLPWVGAGASVDAVYDHD